MSTWTHVVGNIRVDGFLDLNKRGINQIEKIIGPMCLFDKWNEKSTLPRGSEGSLQYKIIKYDDGMPWITIPIWGDLRDYSDLKEIEKWWNKLLPKLEFARDAILLAKVGGGKQIILTTPRESQE